MGTQFNPNQSYPLIRDMRFNKKYYGGVGLITSLGTYLSSVPSLTDLGFLFSTPSEYLVSVKAFPFDLSKLEKTSSSTQNIRLGIKDTGVEANVYTGIKPSLNLGTYKFNLKNEVNEFLNFAPYTKLTLFLPYIGFVELDPNEVMGFTVSFDYAIDLDSGEVTCAISVIDNGDPYVVKTVSGKIAIDIPFGSTNAIEVHKQFITSMIGQIGTSIATIGTGGKGLPSAITKTATGLINSLQHHYNKGGSALSGLNNLPLPQSIYVIWERNEVQSDPNEYKGRPCPAPRLLSNLHGYTEIDRFSDEIDLSFATKEETDELRNLLQTGVYLP